MSKHKQSPKSYSQHMKKVKQSADPTPTTESSVWQIGSSPPSRHEPHRKGWNHRHSSTVCWRSTYSQPKFSGCKGVENRNYPI